VPVASCPQAPYHCPMTDTSKEQEVTEDFDQLYKMVLADVMLAMEREYNGSDYGGTSWTTRAEADRMGELLDLKPGQRLLDLGSGAGWPGLYLAQSSGCDVALTDLPFSGLQIAARRAETDQLSGACWTTVASGAALPFHASTFHAISHSDVLCCLSNKRGALQACREVIRPDGRMVFSVISLTPGISAQEHRRALDNGPPYIETETPYADLLAQTGWHVNECFDITEEFLHSQRRVIAAQKNHESELRTLLGDRETDDRLTSMKNRLAAREAGLHLREFYVVTPAG
jgi:ubiquinone/menaquinone biosynthesis C-methylase UbiE